MASKTSAKDFLKTSESTEYADEAAQYRGSCHCSFTTYTVKLNLKSPNPQTGAIITKCNCSICKKTGNLLAVPIDKTFKLLTPASEDELSLYTFHTKGVQHRFCPKCGVRCWLVGEFEMGDGPFRFTRINALTLDSLVDEDGKEEDVDLRGIKVKYFDHNDWSIGMQDEPQVGGTW